MKVLIENIKPEIEEYMVINCHDLNENILEIVEFVKSRDGIVDGYMNAERYSISIPDVFYFEAVDNKVYMYLDNSIYEIKNKLYELEEIYNRQKFFRCSKSVLLNLMKVESIRPALNGRFTAQLMNGEQVIISRKYVSELKKVLQNRRGVR